MLDYILYFFKLFFSILIPLIIVLLVGVLIFYTAPYLGFDLKAVSYMLSLYILLIIMTGVFTLIKFI